MIIWWKAMILGLVQGLCEFLPISSSGHLVLVQKLLHIEGEVMVFDILLHVGTLVAVCIALWPEVWALLRRPWQRLMALLVVATLPTVAVTLLLGDAVESTFGGRFLGVEFLITAILLLLTSTLKDGKRQQTGGLGRIGWGQSLAMGVMQAFAIPPGISRSGATLAGGLVTGVSRENVAQFSFLMSIPAILGAVVFKLKDLMDIGTAQATAGMSWGAILLGMAVAMVTGVFSIRWMLRIVKQGRLWMFSLYVGVLGVVVLLTQLLMHMEW